MLLGKRLLMKRTASLKEIVFNVGGGGEEPPPSEQYSPRNPFLNPALDGLDHRLLAMVSPRNNRRHSADFLESSQFLRACSLCHRRLVPGRDIYMYKGDSAFCSEECRQQQMNQDERKEKCSIMATKKEAVAAASGASAVTKVSAINGETVAAV